MPTTKFLNAEVTSVQAQTIRTLVDAGKGYANSEAAFDPASVVTAVVANDLNLLKTSPPLPGDQGNPLIS